MKPVFGLLLLVLIGSLMIFISCDSISPDIKDKIKNEIQGLQDKVKQEFETGSEQVDVQLSLPIATMQGIRVGYSSYHDFTYSIFVYLKPTSIAVANKKYIVDLYEKGVLRESEIISWNQPEINVLKEKEAEFTSNRQEYNAYSGENISHIFSIKIHE